MVPAIAPETKTIAMNRMVLKSIHHH